MNPAQGKVEESTFAQRALKELDIITETAQMVNLNLAKKVTALVGPPEEQETVPHIDEKLRDENFETQLEWRMSKLTRAISDISYNTHRLNKFV